MKQEDILHFFIVLFCSVLGIAILAVPLELIYALFEWQPLAARVLIYGIGVVLCFVKGYDAVDVEKIEEEREKNKWDE